MNIPSKRIANAVESLSSLPGIGKKTALRLALHILKRPEEEVMEFCDNVYKMKSESHFCKKCHNISDDILCSICTNPNRNTQQICVVQDIRDVLALESTMEYYGVYHVLGGVISPIDGIGPGDIHLFSLIERIEKESITEIIFALNPSIEGDTTTYYISKHLKEKDIKISSLARGIAFGGELEYTDEFTLAKSLINRQPYGSLTLK